LFKELICLGYLVGHNQEFIRVAKCTLEQNMAEQNQAVPTTNTYFQLKKKGNDPNPPIWTLS
jgi:hypothetical protein